MAQLQKRLKFFSGGRGGGGGESSIDVSGSLCSAITDELFERKKKKGPFSLCVANRMFDKIYETHHHVPCTPISMLLLHPGPVAFAAASIFLFPPSLSRSSRGRSESVRIKIFAPTLIPSIRFNARNFIFLNCLASLTSRKFYKFDSKAVDSCTLHFLNILRRVIFV